MFCMPPLFHFFPLKNKQGNLSACERVCGWERKKRQRGARKIGRERGIERDKERGVREGIGGI